MYTNSVFHHTAPTALLVSGAHNVCSIWNTGAQWLTFFMFHLITLGQFFALSALIVARAPVDGGLYHFPDKYPKYPSNNLLSLYIGDKY